MAITVKKLIEELEKIKNKFLEVEVLQRKGYEYGQELEAEIKLGPRKIYLVVHLAKKY